MYSKQPTNCYILATVLTTKSVILADFFCSVNVLISAVANYLVIQDTYI